MQPKKSLYIQCRHKFFPPEYFDCGLGKPLMQNPEPWRATCMLPRSSTSKLCGTHSYIRTKERSCTEVVPGWGRCSVLLLMVCAPPRGGPVQEKGEIVDESPPMEGNVQPAGGLRCSFDFARIYQASAWPCSPRWRLGSD